MADNKPLETLLGLGDRKFSDRRPLESTWQEQADFFYPERGEFTRVHREGQMFADWLFDGTPVLFRRDLGNNLGAMLRNAGQPWFSVRTGDDAVDNDDECRRWLDGATRIQRRFYYQQGAGVVEATRQCDHDFVTFGNGVLTVNLRPQTGSLMVRNHHLKDVIWLQNDDGVIDHVQQKRKMAGRDISRRWAKAHNATVPTKVIEGNKKDSTVEYELRRIVCPAEDYYGESPRRGKKRAPFVELWAFEKELIAETPMADFIYVIPRWHTLSNSPYAVSPCALVALPDARSLQVMRRVVQEAGEKAVDPPLVAVADMIQGGVNIQAGGITWVDSEYEETKGGAALRALELGKNPLLGVELIRDVREFLANAWFNNKLNLPDDKEMTAFEAGQRVKEYARGVMPVLEPFGPGYSGLMLDCMFRQLLRAGAFRQLGELPRKLQGRETTYQFVTPVDESEGRALVYAFGEVTNITGVAKQLRPDIDKHIDLDTAYREAIKGTGAPAPWLKDEKQVAAEDAQASQSPDPSALASTAELVKHGAGATKAVADAALAAKKAEGVAL